MRHGVVWIVVLIGVIRIRDFCSQFFGNRIIRTRIFRFHGGWTHDDFSAKRLEQVDLLLGLFIRRGKNDFVAANGGDER